MHYSVMLKEVIDSLNLKDTGIFVDATLGGIGRGAGNAQLESLQCCKCGKNGISGCRPYRALRQCGKSASSIS